MSIFKDTIDAMSAYKPPLEGRNPDQFTLLDFNERTIPVSQLIEQEIADYITSGRLQLYPNYGDITEQIADYAGVESQNLMITNGSDQGIDIIIRAMCNTDSEVIIPAPSFPMYTQSAEIEAATILRPTYTLSGGYPLEEVIATISERTRVIVVSNPNNPSGTSVGREAIVRLAKAAPHAAILVDECYFEYCQISVADLVETYSNILVTRTFSKTWGLPSLRIGYLIAAKENIEALLKVRGPYDINQIAVVALRAAFKHQDSVRGYIDEVMQQSKPRVENFLRENNIKFWPSSANFLWVFFKNSQLIEKALFDAGILVRPKQDANGEMGLRITLGTVEQTDHLLSVLAESV